jgi:hypothetical protein
MAKDCMASTCGRSAGYLFPSQLGPSALRKPAGSPPRGPIQAQPAFSAMFSLQYSALFSRRLRYEFFVEIAISPGERVEPEPVAAAVPRHVTHGIQSFAAMRQNDAFGQPAHIAKLR